MPCTNWSKLNNLQLGRYGEYYAMMEISSYGLEVYSSEVDDHGIDFIAKNVDGCYKEIQVKSIRKSNNNYVFMQKDKWNIYNKETYLMLLFFEDGRLPDVYLIPAIAWRRPNELLCDKDYIGLKSKPEYGINISAKNMKLLDEYRLENGISMLIS